MTSCLDRRRAGLALLLIVLFVAGCSGRSPSVTRPPDPTPTTSAPSSTDVVPRVGDAPGRYSTPVFTAVEHANVTFADAPRLHDAGSQALALDWWEPAGDPAPRRPAIVWIHGGGFVGGARSEITDVAREWAALGFVSVNTDYRVDPGSQCMQLAAFSGAARAAAATRCGEAMDAAMHDAQAAVRWVRAHATELGVDPDRVAVGGFSAGALTATHVAQRSDEPGSVGTNLDQSSTGAAAVAASGCSAKVATIDANDAPVFFVASEFDPLVPFSCTTATVDRLTQLGAAPATRFFMGEKGHALALYRQHRAEVMAAWSAFLIHNLGLA